MAEGPNDPQGPFLYQEGGKTYASLPVEMLQNIQRSLLFEKMQKDCKCRNTQDNYGEEPSDPYLNSEGIPTKSSIRENASNGQPSDDAGTGRESDRE